MFSHMSDQIAGILKDDTRPARERINKLNKQSSQNFPSFI